MWKLHCHSIAMNTNDIFSSESVSEGHPDKVCDTISDAILDACLAQDPSSRVACETFVKSNWVIVGGEITTKANFNYSEVIRDAIRSIGYVDEGDVFCADKVFITSALTLQSEDIRQGIDQNGAGDQGLMFGYACDETPEGMPAPIMYAHALMREITRIRKSGEATWLRPDAKSQVSVHYEQGKPKAIASVVISTQHSAEVSNDRIRNFIIGEVIERVLPKRLLSDKTQMLINPSGRFVVGGPQADSGLTGRKIIVDTYGGMARHGGGAFSGKDPSKVDRSAAYLARYIAKNVVAADLASRCEVQFAYAIGHPDPVSVAVHTFGTGRVSDDRLAEAITAVFGFCPEDIVTRLNLLRPIYSATTNYGHFGKIDDLETITWEKTDQTDALQSAL